MGRNALLSINDDLYRPVPRAIIPTSVSVRLKRGPSASAASQNLDGAYARSTLTETSLRGVRRFAPVKPWRLADVFRKTARAKERITRNRC